MIDVPPSVDRAGAVLSSGVWSVRVSVLAILVTLGIEGLVAAGVATVLVVGSDETGTTVDRVVELGGGSA